MQNNPEHNYAAENDKPHLHGKRIEKGKSPRFRLNKLEAKYE